MDVTILLQVLTAVGALIAAVALVWIAIEVRSASSLAKQIIEIPGRIGSSHKLHTTHAWGGCGIFVYRNNRWELESDLSAPGYEPSPPTVAGVYEGQVVKKESWPKARS